MGEFQFTDDGFDSILLATNQDLSPRQIMGVLLHEMCHVSVLKNHGSDIDAHGQEWQEEMKLVGFTGEIDEWTVGLDFFTDGDCESILEEYQVRIITDGNW